MRRRRELEVRVLDEDRTLMRTSLKRDRERARNSDEDEERHASRSDAMRE